MLFRGHRMPWLVGILVLVILALGWVGHFSVGRVAGLTEDLYEHPYMVSTAVLRINMNLLVMHRAIKDILLSDSPESFYQYDSVVNQTEQLVLSDFNLVEDRFMGDRELVRSARSAFVAWKPIRDEVIRLFHEGNRREAAVMSQTAGLRQVGEIEDRLQVLRDFARNKSREFLAAAKETRAQNHQLVWFSLAVALVLSGIVMRKATGLESNLQNLNNSLEQKVLERTTELAVANESLSSQYEEITAMNEELNAQNEEITTLNAELERRVSERTSDLTGSPSGTDRAVRCPGQRPGRSVRERGKFPHFL